MWRSDHRNPEKVHPLLGHTTPPAGHSNLSAVTGSLEDHLIPVLSVKSVVYRVLIFLQSWSVHFGATLHPQQLAQCSPARLAELPSSLFLQLLIFPRHEPDANIIDAVSSLKAKKVRRRLICFTFNLRNQSTLYKSASTGLPSLTSVWIFADRCLLASTMIWRSTSASSPIYLCCSHWGCWPKNQLPPVSAELVSPWCIKYIHP